MRIAVFDEGQQRRPGLVGGADDEYICDLFKAAELLGDRSDIISSIPSDLAKILESPEAVSRLEKLSVEVINDRSLKSALLPRNRLRLSAPLERPGKLICLAGNYREHIAESGFAVPAHASLITPQLFLKPASTIVGDGAEIVLGRHNNRVGWEVELAVVIGKHGQKQGRDIAVDEAFDFVFGYTILNDISERGLNAQIPDRSGRERDKFFDWLAGKWFDTFAPCGPWIATKDEIPDPHQLQIKLSVNGQIRQAGNTREMIHRIPEIISYVSTIMTLEPGDIISTGTPVGAGLGGADTSLHDGDEVVCEIEKIGVLRNRVRCVA
jgi:2-keto-4-pentenoate hydratase/2-oxohepta-3-ene-1,7-dioic acid hydratase in catechol pathway